MRPGQLKRTPFKAKKHHLKPRSTKGARVAKEDAKTKAEAFERAGNACELPGEFGVPCSGCLDPHHLIRRGVKSVRQHPLNILVLCRAHHEFAHANKRVFNAVVGAKFPDRFEQLAAIQRDFKPCNHFPREED